MREPRYIGIDLHRRRFTCCVHMGSGRNYLREWSLEQLPHVRTRVLAWEVQSDGFTQNTLSGFQDTVLAGIIEFPDAHIFPRVIHLVTTAWIFLARGDITAVSVYISQRPQVSERTARADFLSDLE